MSVNDFIPFVSAVLIILHLFLSLVSFLQNFCFAYVCMVALGEKGEWPVSGQTRQTDGITCQDVTRREGGVVENKAGQEEEKQRELGRWRKWR